VVASKEIGLELDADKARHIIMSRDQNAGRNNGIKTDNSSIERVEHFKYSGTTFTNQNSIQEEIKSRLKSGNAGYHSVQNLLSSSLLSKNLKSKIYRTIILRAALYGFEARSLTLREERRHRMFENRVLSIFGPKRYEITGEWRRLHNEELYYLYLWPNIICVFTSRRIRWAGHVRSMWERRGAYRVLAGKPERKRPRGKPRPRWEDNIKIDLQEVGWGRIWMGLIWLRTGTGGGHL